MRCLPGAGDDENHSEEQCERDLQRLRRVPSLKRGIGSWLRCWLNGVIHAGESRAQGTSASGKTLES